MSAFTNAMDVVLNEKGDASLSESAVHPVVTLFFKLVRDLNDDDSKLFTLMENVIKHYGGPSSKESVVLAVMTAQTRDVREGKGERKLAQTMVLFMNKYFPRYVRDEFIRIFANEFGCWVDLVRLYYRVNGLLSGEDDALFKLLGEDEESTKASLGALQYAIRSQLIVQLKKDEKSLQDYNAMQNDEDRSKVHFSLLAKWLPREKTNNARAKKLARLLAIQLSNLPEEECPSFTSAYRKYRSLCSSLTKILDVPEVKMCGKRWRELEPSKIPALCLKKNRKAFFNSGNVEEEDRKICAKNFTDHMAKAANGETKVHGKVLFAHDLVREYLYQSSDSLDANEDNVFQAQWNDLRSKFTELAKDGSSPLGKYVVLSDVSGSMRGTPMEVSIALGILISELCHPTFADRFITFHESPSWHILPKGGSLGEKVRSAANAKWGGTTNFEAAMNLILETAVEAKIAPEDLPEALVVISDMQFDVARGGSFYGHGSDCTWDTQYEKISQAFKSAGYKCPHIIFWNVRAKTPDMPVSHDTQGCSTISGFSQNLLKSFMDGSLLNLTPLQSVLMILDDERYNIVRDSFSSDSWDSNSGDSKKVEALNNAALKFYEERKK